MTLRTPRMMLVILVLILGCVAPARASLPTPILNDLVESKGVRLTHTGDGLLVTGRAQAEGEVHTPRKFKVPLVITAVVQARRKSLRLYYGDHGVIIFNWENNAHQLRFHGLKDGRNYSWDHRGAIPNNQWLTIRWVIEDKKMTFYVDGVERASQDIDSTNQSGTIGLQTYKNSQMLVRSLSVTSLTTANDTASAEPKELAPPPTIEVAVPTTAPAKLAAEATTEPAADPDAIERGAYLDKSKAYARRIATITGLMVATGSGEPVGMASQIIVAVPAASLGGDTAGAGFVRPDGDDDMKTTFEEAVRAVTMRYPYWQPGHMDFSFADKSVRHAGPSAGAAFATLMLSLLDGYQIDPRCGVTGDITVDWSIREVGGITLKLHGATLDKCTCAVIPAANVPAVRDMPLLYGDHALWDINVFSARRLQDVIAIVRTDRASDLRQAMQRFDALRTMLDKTPSDLYKPQARDTLQQILKLAPRDVSAQCMLDLSNRSAPRTLSMNGTLHQIALALHPYDLVLDSDQPLDRLNLPAEVSIEARKRLLALRPIANRDAAGVLAATTAFVNVLDSYAAHQTGPAQLAAAYQRVRVEYAKIDSDPDVIDRMWREGY